MSLGERIKLKRKEKKLTQKSLAQLLGIDHTTISKWESNIYEPDTQNLNKLADILSASTDYLLGSPFFVVDLSKAYDPDDPDGAIEHFIDGLLNPSPFSSTISEEVFDKIEEILKAHNISADFVIDDTQNHANVKKQVLSKLKSIDNIPFKLNLIEELKKISNTYNVWSNEFIPADNAVKLDKVLEQDNLTYNQKRLTKKQINLLKAYLDVLLTSNEED